jgi:hypothetical protein
MNKFNAHQREEFTAEIAKNTEGKNGKRGKNVGSPIV